MTTEFRRCSLSQVAVVFQAIYHLSIFSIHFLTCCFAATAQSARHMIGNVRQQQARQSEVYRRKPAYHQRNSELSFRILQLNRTVLQCITGRATAREPIPVERRIDGMMADEQPL